MGNCMIFTRKRSSAQDKKGDEPPKERAEASGRTRSKTSSSKECDVGDDKKNVKFKLCDKDSINDIEESNGMNKKGSGRVVRIRVVVTQSELSQILKESSKSSSSSSSVEQLLSAAIMLRNRELSQSSSGGRGGGRNGRWKPALESIQEDH